MLRFRLMTLLALLIVTLSFSANTAGCNQEQMVYQRPVAVLNQKAKQLMDGGQPQDAIGRLESALDLMPGEPTTMFNLGIAYQQAEQYEKALATFDELVKGNPPNKAEILKSMGIVYESMADKLIAESQEEPAPPPPKLTETQIKKLEGQAIDNYKMAQQYYEEALPQAQDAGQLQAQIENIKARIEQIKEGKQPVF